MVRDTSRQLTFFPTHPKHEDERFGSKRGGIDWRERCRQLFRDRRYKPGILPHQHQLLLDCMAELGISHTTIAEILKLHPCSVINKLHKNRGLRFYPDEFKKIMKYVRQVKMSRIFGRTVDDEESPSN